MDPVDDLLALSTAEDPDLIDVFEDELAAQLGVRRHATLPYPAWREVRVAAIEAAGEKADELADAVEVAPAPGSG